MPFREGPQWKTSNNDLVTRDTFMKVLKNINGVFIRTTYDENMHSTTISDISISKAAPLNGRSFVEECSCPEGFVGSRFGLKFRTVCFLEIFILKIIDFIYSLHLF